MLKETFIQLVAFMLRKQYYFRRNQDEADRFSIVDVNTIKNQGKELILNFSGKDIVVGKSHITLPQDWVQLKNGVSSIDAFVLAYIFEVAADDSDQERVNLEEKLKFLDIKGTTGLPGFDKYMYVFVEFND